MRTLAIGDIHGCSRALGLLLEAIALQPGDVLVTLGDYVDRGPDSRGVIEQLIELDALGYLVALRGNHELMMLAARDDADEARTWVRHFGRETLASYGGGMEAVPGAHWEFMKQRCVDFWEDEACLFVHANADSHLPLHEQPESALFWERFGQPSPHESGKIMVCGHTAQPSGLPLYIGHAVCIDTSACAGGWLSCLNTRNGMVWQASQEGETRQFWLEDA